MKLYHGSNSRFTKFVTPTGADVLDVTSGGVVYLTDNYDVAVKYATSTAAKKGGSPVVYTIDVEVDDINVVPVKLQRERQGLPKKAAKYVRGIYVCRPSYINVHGIECLSLYDAFVKS